MLREKTGATPGISQETENTEFRGKGRKPPTGSLPYPEKETETQKTNSIPFAKPIRRPMKSDFPTIAPLTETDIDELIAEIKSHRVHIMVATDISMVFSLVPRTVASSQK